MNFMEISSRSGITPWKSSISYKKTYRAASSWYFGVSNPDAVLFIRGPAAIIAGSFARPLGPDLIRRLVKLVLVGSVPLEFAEATGACRPRICCCCTRSFFKRSIIIRSHPNYHPSSFFSSNRINSLLSLQKI